MSKILKSIGKIFRKVVKAIKKFALPILAVGAIVLTGGAALGLGLPTLGGLAGQLGLGAIAPAITAAGQGALIGAAGAAITGQNVLKGATAGFVTGGVVGGLGQAFGSVAKSATSGLPSATGSASSSAAGAAGQAISAPGTIINNMPIEGLATQAPTLAGGGVAGDVVASATKGGGLGGALGGFMKENPLVAGQMIAGLGQGLLGYAGAKAQAKQDDKNWNRVADSYSSEGLLESTGTDYGAGRPTPQQKYQRFGYDPRTGQIVIQEA